MERMCFVTDFLFILVGVPLMVAYLLFLVLGPLLALEEKTGRRVWPGLLYLWATIVVPIAALAAFIL
jgi:nucleoside recognition membrane protein YjiH